jgi:hypothetical protein
LLWSNPYQGKNDTHDRDGAVKLKGKEDVFLGDQKYPHATKRTIDAKSKANFSGIYIFK